MSRTGRNMTDGTTELLSMVIPLVLFMLSPALLPLAGWIIGALHDLVVGGHRRPDRAARGHRRAPAVPLDREA